jgi:hypothetical protein
MTVDEKVGQLNESSGMLIPGFAIERPDDLIAKGAVGSILWQIDVKEINRLQHIAVEKSRLHIPITCCSDPILRVVVVTGESTIASELADLTKQLKTTG